MAKHLEIYVSVDDIESDILNKVLVAPYAALLEDRSKVIVKTKSQYEILLETPLTFEILSSGTIKWKCSNSSISKVIEYKKNNDDWISISSSTSGTSINVISGDKIYFRGNNSSYANSSNYNCFECTCNFNAYGNIMSLIEDTDFNQLLSLNSSYTFKKMFITCSTLMNIQNLLLPAMSLSESCYEEMFGGCSSITDICDLPATNLQRQCYYMMFPSCSSLTDLSHHTFEALSVPYAAYSNMFNNCASLTKAPILNCTSVASYGASLMFISCPNLNWVKCMSTSLSGHSRWLEITASTGTFIKNPQLTSYSRDGNGIPSGWTIENAS